MLEVTLGAIIAISCLITTGLILNIWLLYIIKARTRTFNAIDVLQVIKITIVVLALLLVVPFEFLPCTSQTTVLSAKLCIAAQDFVNNCFFHTICWTLVTVALVRKKICECRGQASVLITRRYGIKTLMLCLTPSFIFTTISGTLILQVEPTKNFNNDRVEGNASFESTLGSQISGLSTRSSIPFTVCHTTLVNFIPIILLCVPYLKIYRIVRQTAQAARELLQNRNFDPSKSIIRTMALHLVLSCTVWSVFICIRIVSVVLGINREYLIFMKLIILVTHPFGEGLLQPSPKKPSDFIHRRIQARFSRQVFPDTNSSFSKVCPDSSALSLDENGDIEKLWTKSQSVTEGRIVSPRQIDNGTNPFHYERVSKPLVVKGRKESREELRKALKVLGGNQSGYTQMRRLSNTLRLSTGEYPTKNLYDSYDMNWSPVLSMHRRHIETNNVCEGYVSAKRQYCENSDGETSNSETPRRRWKRLLTTAKTVKQFSRQRKLHPPRLESCSEDAENIPTSDEDIRDQPNKANLESPTTVTGQTSPTQQTNRHERASVAFRSKRTKSMSCFNNQWLERKSDIRNALQRKLSQDGSVFSEVSNDMEPQDNMLRPISYDTRAHIKLSVLPCPEGIDQQSTVGRYPLYSIGQPPVGDNRARRASVMQLLDMREYF